MSKNVTGFGVVRAGGTVLISHRSRFDAQVSDTFTDGERVCITVEKSTRSIRQNKLLWVWNKIIGDELGLTPEEVHEYDKGRINPIHRTRVDRRTGEVVDMVIPRSTHDMPKDVFAEMMNTKQRLWAEEGIDLPSPNDEEYTPPSA